MKFYFFTSSAVGHDRPWITRFHEDVERELRFREGDRAAGQFVIGTEGSTAEVAAAEVAARVPAMVALTSDDYFGDLTCGLQWSVFRARLPGDAVGRHLICVRWRRLTRGVSPPAGVALPDDAIGPPGTPDEYAGVYGLMRRRNDEQYRSVVGEVVERVIRAQRPRPAALPPDEARRVRPAFGTPAPRPGPPHRTRRTVAISYVGPDQHWADWLGELLLEDGYDVKLVRWDAGRRERLAEAVERARSGADRVVAVLSRNYLSSGMRSSLQHRPEDWDSALNESAPGRRGLVQVHVDRGPLPPGLRVLGAISMFRQPGNPIQDFLRAVGEEQT